MANDDETKVVVMVTAINSAAVTNLQQLDQSVGFGDESAEGWRHGSDARFEILVLRGGEERTHQGHPRAVSVIRLFELLLGGCSRRWGHFGLIRSLSQAAEKREFLGQAFRVPYEVFLWMVDRH